MVNERVSDTGDVDFVVTMILLPTEHVDEEVRSPDRCTSKRNGVFVFPPIYVLLTHTYC